MAGGNALPDLKRDLNFIANCEMPANEPLPPLPPPPSPCQDAIRSSCGAVQRTTKGLCRRCLLDHLASLVHDGGCDTPELTAEAVCADAQPGRDNSSTP
eukprot:SAG31_NODE_19400_length_603_cov_1.222222_1_plen_98_part_10